MNRSLQQNFTEGTADVASSCTYRGTLNAGKLCSLQARAFAKKLPSTLCTSAYDVVHGQNKAVHGLRTSFCQRELSTTSFFEPDTLSIQLPAFAGPCCVSFLDRS